jgi:hypothetical protein
VKERMLAYEHPIHRNRVQGWVRDEKVFRAPQPPLECGGSLRALERASAQVPDKSRT